MKFIDDLNIESKLNLNISFLFLKAFNLSSYCWINSLVSIKSFEENF
jgi:hypothetical protein